MATDASPAVWLEHIKELHASGVTVEEVSLASSDFLIVDSLITSCTLNRRCDVSCIHECCDKLTHGMPLCMQREKDVV
jgi:hypothetical protein